jgi:hypothetical protein
MQYQDGGCMCSESPTTTTTLPLEPEAGGACNLQARKPDPGPLLPPRRGRAAYIYYLSVIF